MDWFEKLWGLSRTVTPKRRVDYPSTAPGSVRTSTIEPMVSAVSNWSLCGICVSGSMPIRDCRVGWPFERRRRDTPHASGPAIRRRAVPGRLTVQPPRNDIARRDAGGWRHALRVRPNAGSGLRDRGWRRYALPQLLRTERRKRGGRRADGSWMAWQTSARLSLGCRTGRCGTCGR